MMVRGKSEPGARALVHSIATDIRSSARRCLRGKGGFVKEYSVQDSEVVIFETIDAIISRPNYQPSVEIKDSSDDRFSGIVGPYRVVGERIPCGISSCRTPNLHGVVIVLKDGTETNVGKVCGAKHFNAEFQAEVRRHDAIYNRHLKLARITALKSSSEKLDRLIALYDEYSTYKKKRLALRGRIERSHNARLERMGKDRDGRVYRYELLAGRELEAFHVANPAAQKTGVTPTKKILIGEIEGVAFLAATFKDEAVLNLVNPMRQIYESSSDEIFKWKDRELNFAHKMVGSIDQDMDRAEELLAQAKLFFAAENIARLSLIGIEA